MRCIEVVNQPGEICGAVIEILQLYDVLRWQTNLGTWDNLWSSYSLEILQLCDVLRW